VNGADTPYLPTDLNERLRKQALGVWGGAAALVMLAPLSMAAAPMLASLEMHGFADSLYRFFSFICHQNPDRSFHLSGEPVAVCARCFGVYSGLFLGFPIYAVFRNLDETEPPSRVWLIASTIPIGLDWTLGFLGFWENTHISRFLTGFILGAACSMYLIPAFVEIARNRSIRRSQSRIR
jgi:uncharacterized membrane protein